MRRGLRSKYILFILSLFMIVGVFLPHGGALAEEAAKKAKYTIDMTINVINKDKLKEELKNGGTILPSGRQVKVYKLKVKNDLTAAKMMELAKKYDAKSIADTEKDLKEQIEKVITSDKSKLFYGDKLYDEIDTKAVKDFSVDNLSEKIKIENLETGYYLIKETDESKKIPKEKLVTQVVKLPGKDMTGNTLSINAKVSEDTPKDYIKLIKVDANNKDKRLNNAEFQLFKKGVDGKEDEKVKLTGQNGVYYRDDEKGDAIALKTWGNGEITVYNLDKGAKYYFKELKSAQGYPDKDNVNKESEPVELGGTVTVENHRTPTLKKIDEKTKKPLEGVEFEVYRKSDDKKLNFKTVDAGYEVVDKGEGKVVTNKDGLINIINLENGKYYLKEIKTLDNYIISKDVIDFEINNFAPINKDKKVETIIVENKLKPGTPPPTDEKTPKGGYHFVKIDSSKKEKRLAGAKFVLMKKEGASFKEMLKDGKRITLTSPDNGEFSIDGLEYGEYALKEIEAPKNHTISQELTPFTVDAASNLEPAKKIVNEPYVPTTVTSRQNTITTRHVPGEITRIVKNPLVKTGDIRIVVMAIIGIILTIMGIRFVNAGERKQRI